MSFLNTQTKQSISNSKTIFDKSSLQTDFHKFTHVSRKISFLYSKRISSFLLSQKEGSMTIEAAIAIPVFLFAILNLLSIILMFGEYSADLADMHQRVKMLSVHAHVVSGETDIGDEWIVQTKINKMESVFSYMGFPSSWTVVNCKMRKWTGYDVTKNQESESEEEWVYITPHGESYHNSRDCRYLSLKIKSALVEEIGEYRNKSGEIYRICESCKAGSIKGICFYTEYGNRYHVSLNCSGLKRTVQTVKKSEVGSRHACSGCCKEGD